MTVLASTTTPDGEVLVETVVDGSGIITGIRSVNSFPASVPVRLHIDTNRGLDRTWLVPTGTTTENVPNNRRVAEASDSWGFWIQVGA